MSKLLLAVMVMLSTEIAFAGKPVVLDFYGKPDTLVLTRTVTKEGSPWGWVAELSVFVKIDKTESDDVLVVQHYEGSKKWGAAQKCPLGHFDEIDHVAEFQCKMDEALAINRAGKFRAEVSYKHVATGKTDDGVGTLKYSVFKYNCDNRHIKGKFAPSPCFVVDNDFRIGEAWLEETLPRTGDVVQELNDAEPTDMYLRAWIKTGPDEPKQMNLRCTYNGKVITKDGLNREQTRIAYKEFPKDNGPQHDVVWRKWWFAMPDMAGRPAKTGTEKRAFYISENPGDYRCVVTSDGDEVAELKFTVGAGGKINHTCVDDSRIDAITASDRRHLVKVTFKPGFNAKYDASAFKTAPFYGKELSKGCPP